MSINIIKNKNDALDLLVNIFKKGSFIPIIGSGFSAGTSTKRHGRVPTLLEYKEHMISLIEEETELSEEDKKEIRKRDFFSIAQYYEGLDESFEVKKDEYHKKNFIDAILDKTVPSQELKQNFLKIAWPYIYTFNYDDVIENSSDYTKKVLANETVKEFIFEDYKCVIKLHGDASNFIYYNNSHVVRGIQQYIKILKSNYSLYKKLEGDYDSQNILFIGCSLTNELDLLAITQNLTHDQLYSNKVMFLLKEPTPFFQKDLKLYSITDIIIVTDYDEIYSYVLEAWNKYLSQKTSHELFYSYKNLKIKILLKDDSLDFFFDGTPLVSYAENTLRLPSYFIQRTVQKKIVSKILSSFFGLIIIAGSRFSGKTYLLSGIMQKIASDDVYIFGNDLSLPDNEFEKILSLENKIFIFDTLSYTKDQFKFLVKQSVKIKENHNKFILAVNSSDEELLSIVTNNFIQKILNKDNFAKFELSNKFDLLERKEINELYPKLDLPLMYEGTSLFDYLLKVEDENYMKQERYNLTFQKPSYKLIALLIILATKEKIYTSEVKFFDFDSEIQYLITFHSNIIQKEFTLHFERSKLDLSQFKYSLISSYLLRRILGTFSKNTSNHTLILKAYDYIINKICQVYADDKYKINKLIKPYIYFNNINNIFLDRFKGKLTLIKSIYEQIHPQLAREHHFLHQHAKCLLSYAIKSKYLAVNEQIKNLQTAYKKCNVALSIINNPEDNLYNEITASNISYTIAVICVLICKLQDYENNDENLIAIDKIESVLESDGFIPRENKNKIDYVHEFIEKMAINSGLDNDAKERVLIIRNKLLKKAMLISNENATASSYPKIYKQSKRIGQKQYNRK